MVMIQIFNFVGGMCIAYCVLKIIWTIVTKPTKYYFYSYMIEDSGLTGGHGVIKMDQFNLPTLQQEVKKIQGLNDDHTLIFTCINRITWLEYKDNLKCWLY